jgi:hypothetical protein
MVYKAYCSLLFRHLLMKDVSILLTRFQRKNKTLILLFF